MPLMETQKICYTICIRKGVLVLSHYQWWWYDFNDFGFWLDLWEAKQKHGIDDDDNKTIEFSLD